MPPDNDLDFLSDLLVGQHVVQDAVSRNVKEVFLLMGQRRFAQTNLEIVNIFFFR